MRQIQIIQYMAQVVCNYIYDKKGQTININLMQIINNERQINMLIDAYNHIKKDNPNV
jgi:hypothetical protein